MSLLFRRLYSRNSVLFKLTIWVQFFIFFGNNAFSAVFDFCRKLVKPIFWSTNNLRYLYSF